MNENNFAEPLTVDQIRNQMRQYRHEFDSDVDQLVASTQSLTDWKQYVIGQPLLAFAVCAIAGYTLIPKKKNASPDSEQIAKLVKRKELVKTPPQRVKPSNGLLTGVLGAATRIGLQTVSGIAMQKLGAAIESSSDKRQSP